MVATSRHLCGLHGASHLTSTASTHCWMPGSGSAGEIGFTWVSTEVGEPSDTNREDPATRPGATARSVFDLTEELVIPISAIEHFVYCPRQCALIHGDGVWADNVHTVRGSRVHRRVDSGKPRRERGKMVLRAIPLWSEKLGLSGRADAVEFDGDRVCPVEYKSGVPHGSAADIQVCAQAMCLEEMLAIEISDGAVWYGGLRRRVRVHFSNDLRRRVTQVVDCIRTQLDSGSLPEAPNDERCCECQLRSHCLPELTSNPVTINRYLATEVYSCAI